MSISTDISTKLNPKEFDDEFFEWEERDEKVPYLNHCIAGSLAGVVEHTILFPFDSIKTHMQTLKKKNNFWEVARDLYQAGGIKRFWRGVTAVATGCIPAHACYFSVYEISKKFILENIKSEKYQQFSYALTGASATLIHDFILTPTDTMKQRMQIAPSHLKNYRKLVKLTYQNEGLQAFYRSYPLTVFMNVPNAAILVGINETLKHNYKPEGGHTIFSYIACAFIAGATAASCTVPLDNIKTRLQTQNFLKYLKTLETDEHACLFKDREASRASHSSFPSKLAKDAAKNMTARAFSTIPPEHCDPCISLQSDKIAPFRFKDAVKIGKTIYVEQGVKGLFKGALPRVITMAPASAISWTTYELMKNWLAKQQKVRY